MTRTDVHSPKNLITEDYEFLGCGNFPTAELDSSSPLMSPKGKELLADGWRFADVETAGCQHCGAFLIYYAVLMHMPSKKFVRVGETCLDNRFELASAEFHTLRKGAKLNRERRALKDKREEFLSVADNSEAYEYAKANRDKPFKCEHGRDGGYYCDCLSFEDKFCRSVENYGEASEKFVAAMLRSKVRQAEWDAEREAERENGSPVVEGKIEVIGEVLKTDLKENDFGIREVMTVKDDRGFKVWGTVPAALGGAEKGNRVKFTATVKKSDSDDQFGFYSRPSKAEFLEEV